MKKIDKTSNFSTAYKAWLDEKESADENHPKYRSDFRFYNDVKFDLLRCQKGLCAYTEVRLCPLEWLKEDNWEEGKYKFEKGVTKTAGQMEHFDATLKTNKGWLWDNLFVADSDVNRDKSTAKVDKILKPDELNYEPLEVLEFDFDVMVYLPNPNKSKTEQERIEEMMEVLGINYPGHVKTRRERFVNKLKKEIDYGIFDPAEYEEDEFPTVVKMIMKNRLLT